MSTYFLSVAADAVLLLHFAYVSFVVVGLLAVLVGLALGRRWARSPVLRLSHLAAILVVVAESLLGMACPLTVWERQLRQAAGQTPGQEDFIAQWVHRVMFFELPAWAFTTAYAVFGLVVLAVFVLAPPRWPAKTR